MYRVALIGYGFAGKTFHAPLIEATDGLKLTIVASRQPEAVLADYKNVAVTNPEAAVVHPDIDLVVIASPNDTHFSLAQKALQAGKHTIVDKPFTTTLAEAHALAALATKQNRVLSVFQNRRWDSDFLTVKAVMEQDLLGEVLHFESHIDRFRPEVRTRWREQPGPGSGLWFDIGPHLIDQALHLFGLPEGVNAVMAQQRAQAQTDDWAHVVLDYGRRKVILHASILAAGGTARFTVHGTRGTLVKRFIDQQEKQLIAGIRPSHANWGLDPDNAIFFDGAGSTQEIKSQRGDYRRYYSAIAEAIAGQAANPVPPDQAIAVMTILETAFQSAAQGRALPVKI
jgi:predicted dehydrogenase